MKTQEIITCAAQGKGSIEIPAQTVTIPPITREVGGKPYFKAEDGMWYPGTGKSTQKKIPLFKENTIRLIIESLAKAYDPRYKFSEVQAALAINLQDEKNLLVQETLSAKNPEKIVEILVKNKIQVKTFDGRKYVGILPPPPKPGPEPDL